MANWLGENGDPELGTQPGGANMIDWIEEIPFNETRNYVQRVSENITIYSALLTGSAKLAGGEMAERAMRLWGFIASGFGSGLAPKAPGTFGSLAGLVIGCLLLLAGHLALLAGIVVATAIGIYAIGRLPEASEDPGWIVIDEIAGQMIPLLALYEFSILGRAALLRLIPAVRYLEAGARGLGGQAQGRIWHHGR